MTKEPTVSPYFKALMKRFDMAYAEWIAARADRYVVREDDGTGDSDEAQRMREEREEAAEITLLATPPPHSTAFWSKWEILERALISEHDVGPMVYPIPVLALAALKADLFAIGLKPWPER